MCSRRITLSTICVLLASFSLRADAPPAKDQDLARENAALKAQVEALQAEVKSLKAKLQAQPELHYVPLADQPAANLKIIPYQTEQPARSQKGMPDGVVEKQFNGMTIYLIPLSGNPGAPKK